MITLYIDTTTSYLYTGITKDGVLLNEIKETYGKDLSVVALKNISEMLRKNGLTPNDIDKIIVVNGPGSFTGIRIGVTIAKTFAYSLKKEITTISSLEAMAVSSESNAKYIVPIIDARRGFVYAGIYDKAGNTILKNQYIKLDTLLLACDNLIGDYAFIGNNAKLDFEQEEYNPNIEKIINSFVDKESINPHAVNPIYLKLTEAEENLNKEVI